MSKAHKKNNITSLAKNESPESSFSSQILTRLEDMEKRVEHIFSDNWLRSGLGQNISHYFGHREQHLPSIFEGRIPKVDVIDKDNEVIVKAELPGIEKDDIEVTMNDRMVTIKASTHSEQKEERDDYYHSEISNGSFCRTMSLPCKVDTEDYKAKFKNGILELTLTKTENSRKKSIKIE